MLEWFKRHAWKACVLQKGTGGSNPFLSAKTMAYPDFAQFFASSRHSLRGYRSWA